MIFQQSKVLSQWLWNARAGDELLRLVKPDEHPVLCRYGLAGDLEMQPSVPSRIDESPWPRYPLLSVRGGVSWL